MKEQKQLFKALGIEFFVQSDSSTEVFKKLRMLTAREIREQKELRHLPGEASLKLFLRARCQVTRFAIDRVYLKHFQTEYEKFC